MCTMASAPVIVAIMINVLQMMDEPGRSQET
jgi:hypothetical protein